MFSSHTIHTQNSAATRTTGLAATAHPEAAVQRLELKLAQEFNYSIREFNYILGVNSSNKAGRSGIHSSSFEHTLLLEKCTTGSKSLRVYSAL